MLRAIIIGADRETQDALAAVFAETDRFGLVRGTTDYPDEHQLGRLLRAHAPRTVFLCVDNLQSALRIRAEIEQTVAHMPVIAFGRTADQTTLLDLMKNGVREFLPMPFQGADLDELANRTEERLANQPLAVETTDLMFSFLPAKPGVGASTLALNLSMALSRFPENRVLLADFDLNSGLIAFMLKLAAHYSVVDAVSRSEDLDENLWPQLVATVGELDVLPCGRPEPGTRISPAQIQRMIAFARRHYGVICVDLSGNMEKYSIELMLESKRIFLVTTPEIPPLHLARERFRFLRELDVGDRVSVLLNRWNRRSTVTAAQIEALLDAPVLETFPNDYTGVHAALVEGKPISTDLDLGARFSGLAQRIMEPGNAKAPVKRKKGFLQSFSIFPTKYSAAR